ncbi:hypothetical protein L484_024721 [Morus notabilis]|uniref:Uncharacterized protein n=1 Tax=Morus notabilis TaxID=981085 RepID=W9R4N4_9ROSA|nr:hypothetical protein L484_024721 [Morus notabilis]
MATAIFTNPKFSPTITTASSSFSTTKNHHYHRVHHFLHTRIYTPHSASQPRHSPEEEAQLRLRGFLSELRCETAS